MTVSLWDIAEAKQERYRLWEQAKALNEKAAAEKRELTSEEKQSWDKMDADLTRMTETIQRQERLLAVKDAQQTAESTRDGVKPQGNTQQNDAAPDEEYNKAFPSWLIGGNESLLPEQRAGRVERRLRDGRLHRVDREGNVGGRDAEGADHRHDPGDLLLGRNGRRARPRRPRSRARCSGPRARTRR